MIALDGTDGKSRLGANAILGVSMASARAAAADAGEPLWRYLGGDDANLLPVPTMNVLNGGRARRQPRRLPGVHDRPGRRQLVRAGDADGRRGLPRAQAHAARAAAWPPRSATRAASRPRCESNEAPLELLVTAIGGAGYTARRGRRDLPGPGSERVLQGRQLRARRRGTDAVLGGDGRLLGDDRRPLPGPLARGRHGRAGLGRLAACSPSGSADRFQLVGDDIFVTNPAILREGIERGIANSILIKLNQIGTLTETLDTIEIAHDAGYRAVISHRSGETEDTFIADLVVATGVGQIKTGAPARSERVAKYNQLLRIEEELGASARYAGRAAVALA